MQFFCQSSMQLFFRDMCTCFSKIWTIVSQWYVQLFLSDLCNCFSKIFTIVFQWSMQLSFNDQCSYFFKIIAIVFWRTTQFIWYNSTICMNCIMCFQIWGVEHATLASKFHKGRKSVFKPCFSEFAQEP